MTEWLHFHFSLSCIGEGNGNPLQCSCLENPRDGEAWWAAIYGVTQSRIGLKRLSSSSMRLGIIDLEKTQTAGPGLAPVVKINLLKVSTLCSVFKTNAWSRATILNGAIIIILSKVLNWAQNSPMRAFRGVFSLISLSPYYKQEWVIELLHMMKRDHYFLPALGFCFISFSFLIFCCYSSVSKLSYEKKKTGIIFFHDLLFLPSFSSDKWCSSIYYIWQGSNIITIFSGSLDPLSLVR